MAELTDYEVQQINNHISSFNSAYNTLSYLIERAYFDSEISSAQSNIDKYLREANDAKSKAYSCIRSALDGSGFFFHSDGLNDIINEKIKAAVTESEKIIRDYDNSISQIIRSISTVDNVFSSGVIFEASEYDEEHQYSFFTEDQKPVVKTFETSGTFTPMEPVAVSKEETGLSNTMFIAPVVGVAPLDTPHVSSAQSKGKDTIVDSLSSILSEDELSGKKQTSSAPTKEPTKRVVITKNTHLDNDEIKKLFLSRHIDYEITLDVLNKAIETVGNDLDKDSIVLAAMNIRFFEFISAFEFFRCYTTIRKAIDIAMKLEKYDTAFDMLCGMIFLETSGYIMAQAHYRDKRSIEETLIDPRITSQLFEKFKSIKTLSSSEINSIFVQSMYVRSLYAALPAPHFTIENSAKLMIKAYNEPHEFLNCKNLGVPYNA